MDQNYFPNFKRRRSNLGRRRRMTNGENAPRIPSVVTAPTAWGLGLSASHSGKKFYHKFDKASSSYNSTKKQLFLNKSPLEISSSATSTKELCGMPLKSLYVSPMNPSPSVHDSSSLNITGISSMEKSPSPDKKPTTSTRAHTHHNHTTLLTPRYEWKTSDQKLCFTNKFFGKLEPPKSPGPSKYNQFILDELADLKPPVDPDDLLPKNSMLPKEDTTPFRIPGRLFTSTTIKEEGAVESLLLLKNKTNPSIVIAQKSTTSDSVKEEPSIEISGAVTDKLDCPEKSTSRLSLVFSPPLSSTYISSKSPNSIKKLNLSCVSENGQRETCERLSVINEDLDSTDSFLLAEQTVIDQNDTIIKPTTIENIVSKPSVHCARGVEQAFDESGLDSDTELDQVLQNIDQMMEQMCTLRKTVENLKHKLRCKKNNNVNNKENIPEPASQGEIKWMKTLKSHNPSLLKTPKMLRNSNSRLSLMNQSTIWTPHSLSTVLHEQVEDLFD